MGGPTLTTEQIRWRVSSFTDNGQCVEVAEAGDDILVRNSNSRDAGTLTLTRGQFAGLLAGAKAGEFDDLG